MKSFFYGVARWVVLLAAVISLAAKFGGDTISSADPADLEEINEQRKLFLN